MRRNGWGLLESLNEMNGVIVKTTLQLITPGILFVFGVAFVCAWLVEKKRNYLLLLASACVLFALGAMSQILSLPPSVGVNAIVSGALYTSAVISAVEGILVRSGRGLGPVIDMAILAGFVCLLAYFFYVDRNLIARVYIQNFGYGLLMLLAAGRLTALARGPSVDRALFWVLLLFGLHFFPRTLLTVGFSAPIDKITFGNSMFWQALQLSLAVLGAGLALAVLAAAVSDMIDDLRRERDFDLLTGILNRRGFQDRVSAHLLKHGSGRAAFALCDIDNFKSINDTLGHDVGDDVLEEVGRIMRNASRKRDIVGRLGGEEFAVFLPDTEEQEAVDYAERLRTAIEQNSFSVLGGARQVTASFGVGKLQPGDNWPSLYKRIDGRLYEAKRTGRNRTISSASPSAVIDARARAERLRLDRAT